MIIINIEAAKDNMYLFHTPMQETKDQF